MSCHTVQTQHWNKIHNMKEGFNFTGVSFPSQTDQQTQAFIPEKKLPTKRPSGETREIAREGGGVYDVKSFAWLPGSL